LTLALTAVSLRAQDLASFEKRITVKKLPNGLTLIVCERPEAPVFSFYTLVDAGSADDPQGDSGLAHMFEHMAFKGTTEIGTTNYPAEKIALAKVETAYAAYDAEYRKMVGKEIGRASCRERVLLGVKISVVAVSLDRKSTRLNSSHCLVSRMASSA
jgi:predicted Zn-dependent peptidase